MQQFTPYTVPLLAVGALAAASAALVAVTRNRRAASWYAAAMVCIAGWAFALVLELGSAAIDAKLFWLAMYHTAAAGSGICWGVFCLVYAGYGDRVTPRVLTALGSIVVVYTMLAVSNPLHGLMFTSPRLASTGGWTGLAYGIGPLDSIAIVPSYLLQIIGSVALFERFLRSRNRYRKVSFLLLLASLSMWFGSILSLTGLTPVYRMTTALLAFLFWGVLGLLGLLSSQIVSSIPLEWLFDRVGSRFDRLQPLGRDQIVEDIESGIVILDADGHVVDINRRARSMLDLSGQVVGTPIFEIVSVEEHFVGVGDWMDPDDFRDQVWIPSNDGERRCYDVNVSAITDGGERVGRTVVIYDITEQKERERRIASREQELQTLKQVYSRFLRHNIRNDITVINGNADWIVENAKNGAGERAQAILDRTDELAETSQKARIVDDVVGTQADPVTMQVDSLVESSRDEIAGAYPDATVRTDVPPGLDLCGHKHLHEALNNAIENAIVHQDSDDPVVDIRVQTDGDAVEIAVVDDGPGIPTQELRALSEGKETALVHGSGIGLWLIDWIVRTSGGAVRFESDDTGTVVRMELPRENSDQ